MLCWGFNVMLVNFIADKNGDRIIPDMGHYNESP